MTLTGVLHKHKTLQQASGSRRECTRPARRSTELTTGSSSTNSTNQSSAGPDLLSNFDDSDPVPEFTFLRTTTNTQEIIEPPHYPEDDHVAVAKREAEKSTKTPEKKRMSIFRNKSGTTPSRSPSSQSLKSYDKAQEIENGSSYSGSSNGSTSSKSSPTKSVTNNNNNNNNNLTQPTRPDMKRKLSDRLHLTSRSRSSNRAAEESLYIPDNLGDTPGPTPAPLEPPDGKGHIKAAETKEEKTRREQQWERRACDLAMHLHVPSAGPWGMVSTSDLHRPLSPRRSHAGSFVDEKQEVNIQEAIRLHEAGNLERSTAIFGRLADPRGANNPLSQVLYGLALRHGWGIEPSSEIAILYLSLAARTAAQIQQMTSPSASGGGDARGELILAIFELGNCFRFGWGCKVDKAAARIFYEVAANLGDADSLEETAWCFMEGFGVAKDKVSAALPFVPLFVFSSLYLVSAGNLLPRWEPQASRLHGVYFGHLCSERVPYSILTNRGEFSRLGLFRLLLERMQSVHPNRNGAAGDARCTQ